MRCLVSREDLSASGMRGVAVRGCSTSRSRGRWGVVAVLAAGALVLTGCGMLEGADPEPTSNGPAEEDPDGGAEGDEPQEFDPDLPRFEPGDIVEGAASDDPWEAVLEVSEQTFVTLDARQPFESVSGRRNMVVTDASGNVVAEAERQRGPVVDIGGITGDPIVYLDLEPGEYLVSLPVDSEGDAADFALNAYVPPVIDVGDTADVQIPSYGERIEEPLADGMLFGIRLPEDGVYTFEASSDSLEPFISLLGAEDQQHWSDYIINDSRGFLQTEFPAGGYTVMVGSSDSEAGSAVLEVSGG